VPLAKEFEGLGKVKNMPWGLLELDSSSALTLLVLRIGADDHDPTMTADHTTFVAHPLD
jgi:hypothetical protein